MEVIRYDDMQGNDSSIAAYLCGYYHNKNNNAKYNMFRKYVNDTYKYWSVYEQSHFIFGVEHSSGKVSVDLRPYYRIINDYEKYLNFTWRSGSRHTYMKNNNIECNDIIKKGIQAYGLIYNENECERINCDVIIENDIQREIDDYKMMCGAYDSRKLV